MNLVFNPAASRLPDQLLFPAGTEPIISRFVLAADQAARRRGVYLTIRRDLDELVALNQANLDSWHPLAPMIDPRVGGLRPDTGLWLMGVDQSGRPVASQTIRHFDWSTTRIRKALCDLRAFYPDPSHQARPGEHCVVSATSADLIAGSVVFSGGTWFHPACRGRGLASIVPRISRAIALARWRTDFAFSLVLKPLIDGGIAAHYGFPHVEYAVDWNNGPAGRDLRFALVWISRAEFLADLDRQTDRHIAEASEVVVTMRSPRSLRHGKTMRS